MGKETQNEMFGAEGVENDDETDTEDEDEDEDEHVDSKKMEMVKGKGKGKEKEKELEKVNSVIGNKAKNVYGEYPVWLKI